MTFIKQFGKILERRRATSKAAVTSAQTTKHFESIAHLCELAAEQETFFNPHLKAEGFLPEWWSGMWQLEVDLDDLLESGKRSENCAEAFDRAGEAYDAATSARDAVLFADEEKSDEVRQALDEEVTNAWDEYWRKQEWWIEAQAEYDRHKERLQDEANQLLNDGERDLVAAGHLRIWSADDSKTLPSARSRSPSRAADDIDDAELQEHAASPPQQRQNHDSENPHQLDAQPRQAENIIAALRREQNDDLKRARAAYSAASADFATLRANYTRRLIAFLEAQRHDAAVGTRTDFDNRYFLARNKATREWRAAKEAHRAALSEASKTGALSVGMREWVYGDEADDGRGSGGVGIGGVLREALDEKVGRWREGVREEVGEGESLRGGRQEFKVLGAVEAWEAEQQRAEGRRRRLIDEWQAEQERMRESRGVPSEVIGMPAGAELQWHEAWNGL